MITRVTAPTPLLTATEAKAEVSALGDLSDVVVERRIRAATRKLEDLCGRAFGSQTLDWFPDIARDFGLVRAWNWAAASDWTGALIVPMPPLISVTSVKYFDTAGDEQTFAAENYSVAPGNPGSIALVSGTSWPTLGAVAHPITVRFVAGYASSAWELDMAREAILAELQRSSTTTSGGTIRRETTQGVGTIDYVVGDESSNSVDSVVVQALGPLWVPRV